MPTLSLSDQVALLEERDRQHVMIIAALCRRYGDPEHESYPYKLHVSFEELAEMEGQGIAEYSYADSIAISLPPGSKADEAMLSADPTGGVKPA